MRTEIDSRLPPAISAIMNAMLDTCAEDRDGKAFDPGLAVTALTSVIAVIMESSSQINTPRDMRLAGESLAKEFRAHLQGWRKIQEITGERAWFAALAGIKADETVHDGTVSA